MHWHPGLDDQVDVNGGEDGAHRRGVESLSDLHGPQDEKLARV